MIRMLTIALMLASPAAAWEFSPTPICTLTDGQATITYDGQIYTLTLTRDEGWPQAEVFAITFEGTGALTISTDRHRVNGTDLTVSDRGFGNVLRGWEDHSSATASLGDTTFPIDLSDAAEPTRAFTDCDPAILS